jgi:hypothetical protein
MSALHPSGVLGVFTKRDRYDVPPGEPRFGKGWIEPGTDEWRGLITPSKVAAIVSKPGEPISRYESAFRLWHRMKGLSPEEPPKDAFDLGHDAEVYAAARWRRANPGWLLSPDEVQVHIDPAKFGFPAVATVDRRGVRGSSRRVVEFKIARNLTDLEAWGDDLKGECPEDYFVQVSALMLFTGWVELAGDLFVIGPYFQERSYPIAYDPSVASWIITECSRFYESLKGDEPPELDNSLATYECLRSMHPDIDPDATTILDEEEALDFTRAHTELLDATEQFNGARNRLVKRMERDKRAEFGGVKVAERRNNGKGGVSFYPNKAIRPDDLPTT